MVKIYGKEKCPRCVELRIILETSSLEFEYIQDIKELRTAASKARVMMAPVVEYNGEFLGMEKFLERIK